MKKALLFLVLFSFTQIEAAKSPKVEFDTNHGKIVIELNQKKAPLTVANFLKYTKDGFYNGTVFHRVIGNFMIQGGGFEVKEGKLTQKKTGKTIKNEAKNGLKNSRATIAMARTSDPHSASSQFFINVVDNDRLNYSSDINMGYAVFGKVVKGMKVVDKIRKVSTTRTAVKALSGGGSHVESTFSDVPKENVIIKKARILK